MFIIIFVPMNKVKLLVHRREVSIEQQQVVQARVIWYVPCTCTWEQIFDGAYPISPQRHVDVRHLLCVRASSGVILFSDYNS